MAGAESNMAEFKMAAIIQVESEWMSEVFLCKMAGNPRWQNVSEFDCHHSRWLNENEWAKVFFVQNGWIQDGCHHQVKSDWISLSHIELVWVRVCLEWESFWMNLREDNKSVWIQDGSVWIQDGRIQDGYHHQVESEWIEWSSFCANGGEGSVSEVFFGQMVSTNLCKCEWLWE